MKYTKVELKNKTTGELIEIILKLQIKNNVTFTISEPHTIYADGTQGMRRGE